MASERTKQIISMLSLSAILIFVMVLVSQTIGLGRTGFDSEDILKQFYFYAGPGGIFLIGIIVLFTVEYLIKEKDNLYGNSIAFNDGGEFPSAPFKILKNPFKLFLLSVIVFGVLGIYVTATQQTFTGVGQLKQQFTVLDSVLFSSTLVPASENLGAAFLGAITIFGLRFWARKKNFGRGNFAAMVYIIIPIIFGLFGLFNHLLRYGSSDIDKFSVFVFWYLGGAITIFTGSFIPFWVAHIINNLFFDLTQYFSSDGVLVGTIGAIIFLIIFYAVIFRKKEKPNEPT